MNCSIIRTLVMFSLSAALSPVALMAQSRINANIPFDFTVGAKSFAAGNYSVHRINDHVLVIQNVKNGSSIMSMVLPGQPAKTPSNPVLRFNRYGNSYFLAEVAGDGEGWQFHKSSAEKELIAKVAGPNPVVVAAALRSK